MEHLATGIWYVERMEEGSVCGPTTCRAVSCMRETGGIFMASSGLDRAMRDLAVPRHRGWPFLKPAEGGGLDAANCRGGGQSQDSGQKQRVWRRSQWMSPRSKT